MASILEEYIECPICYFTFEGPDHTAMILKCMHSICQQCLRRLVSYHHIECPICKDVSAMSAVRKDFKTAKLVDSFLKESKDKSPSTPQADTAEKLTLSCQLCDAKRNIVGRCQECNVFLCDGCVKGHKKMKELKAHTVQSVGEANKEITLQLCRMRSQLQALRVKREQKVGILNVQLNKLDDVEATALREISAEEIKMVEGIKLHHDALRQRVTSAKATLEDEVTTQQQNVVLDTITIDNHLQEIQELLSGDNTVKVVIKKGIDILQSATKAEKLLEKNISEVNTGQFQVTVSRGVALDSASKTSMVINSHDQEVKVETKKSEIRNIEEKLLNDVSTQTEVIESTTTSDSIPETQIPSSQGSPTATEVIPGSVMSCEPSILLSSMSDYYTRKYFVILRGEATSLQQVGDRLWCTTASTLYVYSKTCDPVDTIQLGGVGYACAIVGTKTGQLLVADPSWKNGGLKRLANNGTYIDTLVEGTIGDVKIHQGQVYALQTQQSSVLVFKTQQDNSYKLEQTLKFSASACDNMYVIKSFIYISSKKASCVYMYGKDGQLLKQFGRHGHDFRGQRTAVLHQPRLCVGDAEGRVMVAEKERRKLWILNQSQAWKEVRLVGGQGPLSGAAVAESGDCLWVIEGNKLSTYETHEKN